MPAGQVDIHWLGAVVTPLAIHAYGGALTAPGVCRASGSSLPRRSAPATWHHDEESQPLGIDFGMSGLSVSIFSWNAIGSSPSSGARNITALLLLLGSLPHSSFPQRLSGWEIHAPQEPLSPIVL